MTYRLVVLYPQPRDPAAFRAYYEATHLKLVARLPGLRRSEWGFELGAMGQDSPYFCIFQGDFDSQEAMQAAMGSPEGQAVVADVANYATGGCLVLHHAVLSASG
jgi:uncharacterized protein (TIGR02118 family)